MTIDRDNLRRLCAEAPEPNPEITDLGHGEYLVSHLEDLCPGEFCDDELATFQNINSARFFIGARTALPELLDELEAKDKRIALLEATLKPFAEHTEWARKHEWPESIAADPGTPVYGHDDPTGETLGHALYVGDFDNALAALTPRPDHD